MRDIQERISGYIKQYTDGTISFTYAYQRIQMLIQRLVKIKFSKTCEKNRKELENLLVHYKTTEYKKKNETSNKNNGQSWSRPCHNKNL